MIQSCATRIIAAPMAAGTATGIPVREWVKKPTKMSAEIAKLHFSSSGC